MKKIGDPVGSRAAIRPWWRKMISIIGAMAFSAHLSTVTARAHSGCFIATLEEYDRKFPGSNITHVPYDVAQASTYLLGLDTLLAPVQVLFFKDGHVCGYNLLALQFEGDNIADGQLQVHFMDSPYEAQKHSRRSIARTSFIRLGDIRLTSVRLTKHLTDDIIFWEGSVKSSNGIGREVYLKRTRKGAKPPPDSSKDCGDDDLCQALSFKVTIKPGSESTLLADAKQLPITSIVPCDIRGIPSESDESCFAGETWPLEESSVVNALRLKSYVLQSKRLEEGHGADSESFFLESDKILADNSGLNIPVAVSIFQDAVSRYFKDTNVFVSEAAYRQNSLFWQLKGRRSQFEKNPHPSPSERSEWWKVRLQVAVTGKGGGKYVLFVGLPETRVFDWALDSVPNDEKFTTELTNDLRFEDLRGRLIVALTKFIPGWRDMP
jgi:hypothetical protein